MSDHARRFVDTLGANMGVLLPTVTQLMAEAWDEGVAGGLGWNENLGEDFATPNPYRSATEAAS